MSGKKTSVADVLVVVDVHKPISKLQTYRTIRACAQALGVTSQTLTNNLNESEDEPVYLRDTVMVMRKKLQG